MTRLLSACLLSLTLAGPALAQFDTEALKKAANEAGKSAGEEAKKRGKALADEKIEKRVNAKLLAEARKNQCAFKTDSDDFQGSCDAKVQRLFNALVDAKKAIVSSGVSAFKFEVSGHTDSRGSAAHNKELSLKRAARIVAELKKKGIPEDEIIAVGKGSEAPLVKNDNTPKKQAQNRRYEIRVRLQTH